MEFLKSVVKKYTETSLIIRIVIGLVAGAILGRTMTGWTWIGILGSMFVGALRAVAPVLVFVLIISALSNGQSKLDSKFGLVAFLLYVQYISGGGSGRSGKLYIPGHNETG